MNRFSKQLRRRIPRHGEGLLGVGAAYAAAVFLSVLFAEIFSSLIPGGYTSFNKAVFDLVSRGELMTLPTLGIFVVFLVFLGAIAFAGSTRYLMGCVDPDHIAQRTFSIGIRVYTKKMFAYSMFMSFMLLVFLGVCSVAYYIVGILGFTLLLKFLCLMIIGLIFLMLMTKMSYTPMFMIQGKGLFAAIGKSWVATGKRFWLVNLIRLILVLFVFLPILLKWIVKIDLMMPSIENWPYAALIITGFEEIMVTIGFQEYEEDSKEPIVSNDFAENDLQLLEDYNRNEAYADKTSMEY
jgi:hypothetical protein